MLRIITLKTEENEVKYMHVEHLQKLVPVSYIKVIFSHPSNCCICFSRGGVNLKNLLIRDLNYKRRH